MPSWLKKVGQVALRVGEVTPYGNYLKIFTPPAVDKAIDTIIAKTSHLDEIGKAIINAEVVSNTLSSSLSGSEKLKLATGPTAQILLDFLGMRGIEVVDEKLFLEGSQDVANGIAKILNSGKAK
jgi:hypothetical protein